MQQLITPRKIYAAPVFIVLLGIALLLLTAPGGSHDVLQGVPPESLASSEIRLERADAGASEVVDSQRAVEVATKQYPEGEVLEVVLVHLTKGSPSPYIDKVAWAVNFKPDTVRVPRAGPFMGTEGAAYDLPTTTVFSVAFVDAKTGEYMFWVTDSAAPR